MNLTLDFQGFRITNHVKTEKKIFRALVVIPKEGHPETKCLVLMSLIEQQLFHYLNLTYNIDLRA